jgi:hypothetical protein
MDIHRCEQGLRCLDRLPLGLGSTSPHSFIVDYFPDKLFGCTETVGRVVLDKEFLSHPTETAFKYWEKSGRNVAANGSLMRTSPIGIICLNRTEEETFQEAIRMGAITHADPRCALSVATASALVRALCKEEIKNEKDVDELLERAWAFVTTTASMSSPELSSLDKLEFQKHAYAKTLESLVLCDGGMGYVYKCLGSGIWCLRQVLTGQETFKSAMIKLVMCGGDADTNGVVAGAFMGAYCGWKSLPAEWRDGMEHEAWYREKIDGLCMRAGLVQGNYDVGADRDTEVDGGRGFLSEGEMKKRETELVEKILMADKARRDASKAKKKSESKKRWKFW